MNLDEKKFKATAWFRDLRDQLCAEFEMIENELNGNDRPVGKFSRQAWSRSEGGSGEISIMKGRVFEKVGVNISVVHGQFSEQFRHEIPGAAENPNFWAAGISLVAHLQSPLVPAAHFNTRMIAVGDAPTRLWFGGGGDLNPMVEDPVDTAEFHEAFKKVCDDLDAVSRANTAMSPRHASHAVNLRVKRDGVERSSADDFAEQSKTSGGFYEAFTKWCDEYFFIPHRQESRGVGGIFYDYLGLNAFGTDTSPMTSGKFGKGGVTAASTAAGMQLAANAQLDWDDGFAFTQNVGKAFLSVYPKLIRRHMQQPWNDQQRHHQLVKRGRYAEYNLLYDRGTRFGLMTGGNPEAILMSLPPMAIWE